MRSASSPSRRWVEGDFARTYTDADNSQDGLDRHYQEHRQRGRTRKLPGLSTEEFCQVLAKTISRPLSAGRFLRDHVARDAIGTRLSFDGKPHPHSFELDSNGKPTVEVTASRGGSINAGLRHRRLCLHEVDPVRQGELRQGPLHHDPGDRRPHLRDQHDGVLEMVRRCRRAIPRQMPGSWPTLLEVFATTYSRSVQDSLYRMGEAALAAVPEISEISMACPNMHFIPMNLSAFGLDNNNDVFLPTDEPHGQIECTVGRG